MSERNGQAPTADEAYDQIIDRLLKHHTPTLDSVIRQIGALPHVEQRQLMDGLIHAVRRENKFWRQNYSKLSQLRIMERIEKQTAIDERNRLKQKPIGRDKLAVLRAIHVEISAQEKPDWRAVWLRWLKKEPRLPSLFKDAAGLKGLYHRHKHKFD